MLDHQLFFDAIAVPADAVRGTAILAALDNDHLDNPFERRAEISLDSAPLPFTALKVSAH